MRWKLLILTALAAYALACAPKRNITQFAKNKEAEAGQTYTEEQLRAALGSDRYDALVVGIGQDNLNLLAYGIGVSNMTTLMNGIATPGKLPALMSDGPNSRKMNSIEVLDLLNKLDDACQQPGAIGNDPGTGPGTDTLGKMVNMINNVTVAGMEGIKNIVHGVQDQPLDLNGTAYQNGIGRLAFLISLLNENLSVMPTLVNDLAAPSGTFSASGNAKLIRLVNESRDMRDLAVIINNTTLLGNITAVMSGLTGNMYCSKPEYITQATCTGAGGAWTNTLCSNPTHTTRAACTGAGATWTSDGIENMGRLINELDRVCSNPVHTNGKACIDAGATWRTKASKIPVIVNNISNVPNMYTIVNGLTNDGKRPPWPTVALPVGLGLPTAYAGDVGNVFDGVDSMVATINKLYVGSDADSFGTNGTLRLAYMVNNLDTTGVFTNDTNFDTNIGTGCLNGEFDNRMNWAFSNNQATSGTPWWGKSWRSGGGAGFTHSGACSIRNDGTAATVFTQTQTAEMTANITTNGNMTFYTREALGPYDTVRFYVDDVQVQTFTGNSGTFTLRTQALTAGVRRLRWDVQRALNSTGVFYLDTVTLPGDKGAARTAAQKTFIMLNNLYIASSITNVADILSNVTAPACVSSPLACTPSWDNGLDTLIHTVNRVEYPASIAAVPRLATTVNSISNLQIMYDILNNMNSQASTDQLVALMDFVQTPANVPDLINALTGAAGVRTADILKALNPAGTSNMLRVMANTPNGAPILDVARLLNGVSNTIRVAEILNKLKLTANVYSTSTSTVTFTVASPTTVTWSAGSHGFLQNARISFTSTIKLPSGVNSGQVYYVCPLTATTFRLSNDLTCSSLVNTTAANSGTHTALAGDETFFNSPNPGGGAKLAQFFNAVNAKGTGSANVCNVNDNEDDFCIRNHLVRLVNDIATSAAGSTTVAEIVSNLIPIAGPGGNTGVTRMVDVLFEMKNQNSVTPYTNALSNSTSEDFGRLTTFIKDMTGGSAGLNTARMVNEVNLGYMSSRVTYLLKNVNRMRYLSRLLSEMTSVDLMLLLLNDANTNIARIDTLVDTQGNLAYGTAALGVNPASFYGTNPTGAGCTDAGCDTSTADTLGRLIVLINQTDAISNVIAVVNRIADLNFIASPTATFNYGTRTDGTGYGFINAIGRINYMSDLMNGVTNIDLLIAVINGAGSCSNATYQTYSTCIAASAIWTEGNMSGGIHYGKMLTLLNNVGASQRKGPACTSGSARVAGETSAACTSNGGTWNATYQKNVGDISIIWDTINKLAWNQTLGQPRTIAEQMNMKTVVNDVQYCGLQAAFDSSVTSGAVCSNAAHTNQQDCIAAGATWNNAAQYYTCDSDMSFNYQKGNISYNYDRRHRLSNLMLGVTDATPLAIIVGGVTNPQKTIRMINATRRINSVIGIVNNQPGEVTQALVNTTHINAVYRSLTYLVNNLEPDEDIAVEAFVGLIHKGTGIPDAGTAFSQGTNRNKFQRTGTCHYFTGIGPNRLGELLNTGTGKALEGLIVKFGWRTSIPAMVCGFGVPSNSVGSLTNPQQLPEDYGSAPQPSSDGTNHNFSKTDWVDVTDTQFGAGTYRHRYQAPWWGTASARSTEACLAYMPEETGASVWPVTSYTATDSIVWNGLSVLGNTASPGIQGVWDIINGTASSILSWMLGLGTGEFGFPPNIATNQMGVATQVPAIGGPGTQGTCAHPSGTSTDGDENSCLKPAGSVEQWGTYCSDLSTKTDEACSDAVGTKWRNNKNYDYCRVPLNAPPVRYNCNITPDVAPGAGGGGTTSSCNANTGSGRKGTGSLLFPGGYSEANYP
jgi:hypothetical protein